MALNMSAALNITANVQGAQSVSNLNNQLKQLGQQGDISAKQLANAYRNLGAQLQDVFVSIAGGQNPFMVLTQQGSQVATQFGGIGNAIRGIASVLTPVRLAFAGAAGAVAAFGYAALQGYQESVQLQRQLAITGNMAGMTADSFERSAARIRAATGATALVSREMLMGAAGSGEFGPASIDAAAQAMTHLQRLTGQSSEEVAKLFNGMSKGVADWAAEANRKYNFLTVEQYKYIRQLEDQGQKEAAIKAALDAVNGSLKNRTVELGTLERAWKAVKEESSKAWNAMMNIGRPSTMADQISDIETRLRNSEAIREGMRKRGQPVPGKSQEILDLEAQLAALKEAAALNDRAAEAAGNRARANQQAIKAEQEAEDKRKKAASEALSKEHQRLSILQGLREEIIKLVKGEDELTLAKMRNLGATQKQIDEAKALAAQLKENKGYKEAQEIIQGLREEINKLAFTEEEAIVIRLRAAGASEGQITQARLEQKELEKLRKEKQYAKDLDAAREKQAAAMARQDEERQQILKGMNEQVYSLRFGEDELLRVRLSSLGASEAEMEALDGLIARKKRLREEQQMESEAKSIFEATRTPAEKLNTELARLNKLLEEGKINWDTYSRAVFKAQDEFDAVGKKGKDTMDELKQAVEGWGKSAADAFVQFAFTGKISFNGMVNSILGDIARMLVYKNITGPLFNAIGSMMPALPFASGGIMTSDGAVPLNRYASGGIANSPQLALFGEGRMPEAYVPLPDGRSIPVTMQGGSGETNVVVNVNMQTGEEQASSGNQRGTDLGLVIASVVKQELINQRRPGGLLAAA